MMSNTTKDNPKAVPAVKAIQVHKAFGDLHVLKGVDMTVEPGSVTVILGPSGSGKSTLLRLINQLETLTGGEIDVDGEMIGYKYVEKNGQRVLQTLNDKEVAAQRAKLGMVFQRFNLFPHMTALENVMEAPVHVQHMGKQEAKELAIHELERVGLGERLDYYPSQLSGGQQQRLCIARAMAVSPSVLLMDEPASALDPISTAKVEELIHELKKDYTIVIVTHNMQQAARVSDKTAFFYLGEMVEYGDTKRIFTNPEKEATQNYITGRFG